MHFIYAIFFLIFNLLSSELSFALELNMDCGTQLLFVGEKALCQFTLTGDADLVEVEVAKFPEFRGFWSENLSLRQGAMALVPVPTRFGVVKQAVVGSYLVHRMIDKSTSEILPMKISVKKRGGFQRLTPTESTPEFLMSKGPQLKMLSLPPIPDTFRNLQFKGAVGEFTNLQSQIEAEYRLNEPLEIRIMIQGKGNFAEINELPIQLPQDAEVVSQRSSTQASSASGPVEKQFYFSILLKSRPPENFPLGEFLFFDPTKKAYLTFRLPELKFLPAHDRNRGELNTFSVPKPEPQWSASTPWEKSKLLWWGQAFVLLGCFLFRWFRFKQEQILQIRESAQFRRQETWNSALKAHQEGDSVKFIQLATVMFTELLKEKKDSLNMRPQSYPTKKQLLVAAKNSLSEQQQSLIEGLFSRYDEIYSPTKPNLTSNSFVQGLKETLLKTQ